jgi:hypothetical protein
MEYFMKSIFYEIYFYEFYACWPQSQYSYVIHQYFHLDFNETAIPQGL